MAEKTVKKAYRKDTISKILKYVKKYRFSVALSLILAAVTVASTLYVPILTGQAIDCIVGPGNVDFKGVYQVLQTVVTVLIITAVSQWIMNVCNNRITYRAVQDIRRDAFAKIEILPLRYIDSHSYGEVVSRVIADVDQFADGLLMGFTQLFTGVMTIVGTLGFMLSVNVRITAVVVLITPVSFLVAGFIAKRTYSMFKLQSETRGEQTALIEEAIGNQKVVQAFGYEEECQKRFDVINQ